ncbi:MAG: hypothetical protein M3Y18_05775 [Candidatus Eremiobacteraeota bacterium]|nr:hypothetical protein [Candidatus Eremiobacteraeota bacterium]
MSAEERQNERTADGEPLEDRGMHDPDKNRTTPPTPRPPDDDNQSSRRSTKPIDAR